jgi:PTH2 family peptidyl-tRNA hydrolase
MKNCIHIFFIKMESKDDYVMYIFVNTDLKMGKGKLAAQVGHVVGEITEYVIRTKHAEERYKIWKNTGYTKIVLKATEKELELLMKEDEAFHIRDLGRTQIAADSLTVVGFLPSNTNKDKFKSYRLL